MKKAALILALASVVVMPAAAFAQNNRGNSVPRNARGVLEGRFTFEGPWEGPWTTAGNVTGTLSHLGLAKMNTIHQISAEGNISDGTFEILAANGDKIWGTYTASGSWVSADQVLGSALLWIDDGTGRFKHASGAIIASFLETFDDPSWSSAKVTWSLNGTISY
jgi:hypothetical protein